MKTIIEISAGEAHHRFAAPKVCRRFLAPAPSITAEMKTFLRQSLRTIFAAALFLTLMSGARAGNIVQEFYLPMPEAQIYQANNSIISGSGSTIDSTFSIIVTGNGTVIYYDQWEDGYETDLSNPTQSTTQIWGDGNDAHGIPPGFAHNPLGLPAGTIITLTNNVTQPRNPSVLLWDAGDHIGANKAIIITRAGWPTATGPVFAGAVSVLSTMDWGTNYICPVGQNLTNINLMKYVGMLIMAAQNNTSVTVDPKGTGVGTTNFVLNQGESYLVNGGVMVGGRVTASKPIQTDVIIGHVGASYASDWFTLYPAASWSSSYFTPVGSASKVVEPAYVYLYNPNSSAITINYTTKVSSGSVSVAGSNGVYQFQMPTGSGASFISAGGQSFYALCTVAANNSADTAWNWGFTLVPQGALTTEADVGWAPGSANNIVDGSPVWVTALSNTVLYVDYKGDHQGPLTDRNGNKYDTNITVTALQSQKIFDPSKDQSGMRVYTVDGTLITAAWGEDADTAQPGDPYIDAGYTVLPFPVPTLKKTASIVTDVAPAGLSIGDTIQYTVEIDNKGLLPLGNTVVIDAPSGNLTYVTNSTSYNGNSIPDNTSGNAFPLSGPGGYTIPIILSQGTSTFQYKAMVNAAGIVSNSVNIGGTTLFSQTTIQPSTNGASVTLSFTDTNGAPVTTYVIGANVFVTMTNVVANTSSNTAQSLSVNVLDQTSGDVETIVLTETGTNTGVFRNASGLPTFSTSGLSQQDGILHVAPGDTVSVNYTDPIYGDSASATALIAFPTPNKQLYLSINNSTNGTQDLNRIDPVFHGHGPTQTSIDIGQGGGLTFTTNNLGIDNAASTNGSSSPINFNYNTGTGTNRLMLVSVALGDHGGAPSVSGVTYKGTALVQIANSSITSGSYKTAMFLYALTNPATGNNAVSITTSSASDIVVGIDTFSNVNQTTPFSATNVPATPASSITILSAANQLVFGTIASVSPALPASTQQSQWTNNSAGNLYAMGGVVTGSSSTTMSWTTNGCGIGVAINPSTTTTTNSGSGGPATNVTSFVQTPAFALPFTIVSNGTVTITNFITVTNGVLPPNPAVTAYLQYNGATFLALSNANYSATNNITNLVWTALMASNVTIAAGQSITYVISNGVPGTAFHVNYDSTNAPSVIVLPASSATVISVNSVGVFDAPYPNENIASTPVAGSTVYIDATVSDPFGTNDITGIDLAVTGPTGGSSFTNHLTDANVVSASNGQKLYEFQWATGPTTGNFTVAVTAHEGTEGVTGTGAATVTTTFLDLGTPSSTEFISGTNNTPTNSYPAGSPVCLSVTALDSITNSSIIQTIVANITSSSGDSENLVLTETGTNTGVYTGCINTSTNNIGATNDGTLYAPVGSVLTATYNDPNDSSYDSSATATIQPAPGVSLVSISKSILSPSGGQVGVGQSVTFNLAVINSGSTTLSNLSISDNFPSSVLTYSSASVTPNTISASQVTWTNLGSFTPGQTTNITVTFTTSAIGLVTNTAIANGVTATNSSSATLLVTKSALNVVKTLLSPASQPVGIGSNVVFRVTVQNVGNTVVNYLPMEDSFSAAYYQFVSATIPPNGSGAGSLVWTNLASTVALATNATITNDITMKVVGQGSPANNVATVDYATDIYGNPVPTSSSTIGVTTLAASINGHVYEGSYPTIGPGLSGVTLQLFTDPNGDGDPSDGTLQQVTTTDANGYFEFLNLPTGHYVIVETLLPGFAGSYPANNRQAVNVATLAAYPNQAFFQYIPTTSSYSTVSGTVWNDVNGNGVQDAGESGLANIEIDLVQDSNTNGLADSGEPIISTTTTDTNGNYTFAGVTPGHYVIREDVLFGYYSDSPLGGQMAFSSTNGIVSTNNNFANRLLPDAVNDTNAAIYGYPLTIDPLTNDISPNGDGLTITSIVASNGIVVTNASATNFVFTPTNSGAIVLTYSISDAHGGASSASVFVNASPAPLSATANNASRPYGQSNPAFTGTLTGVVNGDNITASYSTIATSNSPAGAYPITPTLVDPNSRLTNYSVTLNNGTLTITPITPQVTWTNPAPIVYGTPLSTNQLDATSTVPGTFVYNPTNGTVLNVGTNTLGVVFTPTDTNDYNASTNFVSLVVQPAPLTVTANNASRAYGQANPTFTGTLLGVTNGDNITATYSTTATSNSPAGTYAIVPALADPNNRLTNYAVTINNGTLTIQSAGSTVTWTNSAPIVYGTPLSTNQLDATSTVPGTFVYNPTNGSVLNVGTNTLSVVFTPTDTNDYNVSTNFVSLAVQPAPLTVTANNASRAYGQANTTFTGTLLGVTNGDNITATYSTTATSNSPAGTYAIVPTLIDPNNRLTNYSVTINNGTLTIQSAGSTVTWTNSAPIVYGTPLSTNQLDATSTVPGTFVYNPTNGSVLNVGTNTLSVVFTPTDTNDYNVSTNFVSLAVQPAPLTVTANNASRAYGQANPTFTGTLLGVTNGDNITATYSTTATSNSPAGTYAIVPALVDPNNRLTNYAVTINNGTLTIQSAGSTVTWTNPAPIVYGTPLSTNQLDATSTVPGTFVYNPTNGSVLNVGTNTLGVVFTPSDTNDYNVSTNFVSLVVQPAPLTVTANNASRAYGQANPTFTGTLLGVTNGDNITATYSTTATSNSSAGTYAITPTLIDPNNRLTNYSVTINNGTLTIQSAGSTVTWTNPAPIVYGTPLSTNQLDATSTVPGTFVYNPTNGTVLNVGTNTLGVVFTPTDTNDYNASTNFVSLVVQPAPLTVTANNASRAYGQANPIFTGALLGVTNGDNITATYSTTATSNSPAGTYAIVPALVDPNNRLTNYSVTINNGTLTIQSAGSTVTWTNPAPIVYGTPLSTNQLDATSTVPGTFVYNPTSGTILNAGSYTLSVVFTPTDTNDYNASTNTVSLVVQTAPLTITANSTNRPYGQPNPTFTGSLLGVTNGDNITATYFTTATSNSAPGAYPITATLADPNHRLTNYSVVTNNGTLTVQPAADIAVFLSAPTNITAGSNLTYTITLTNLGPNASSNVVVGDTLPGNVTFVSASGGGVDTSGVVTWPTIPNLANGGIQVFTLVVKAPASGSITNKVYASSATIDPNPANNNGTGAGSQASTLVTPAVTADIAVLDSGLTNVTSGQQITYTITVTNLGPSSATGVIARDNIPTNTTFVSASTGGTNTAGVVIWSIGSMTNGQTTNVTVTVTAPASGSFTNIASATSTSTDPNPANNNGTAANSQVSTTVTPPQFGILAGAITLNAQTGLYEEPVTVTNTGAATIAGVRLYVGISRTNVYLYNASGTNGQAYAQYNSPLNPNQTVTFTLEFYNPMRQSFTTSLTAVAITNPTNIITNSGGGVPIKRVFMDTRIPGQTRFVIEFTTVPGKSYTIIYSDDNLQTWKLATPTITAGSTSTQWYDDGPPETDSAPTSVTSRYYEVILNH